MKRLHKWCRYALATLCITGLVACNGSNEEDDRMRNRATERALAGTWQLQKPNTESIVVDCEPKEYMDILHKYYMQTLSGDEICLEMSESEYTSYNIQTGEKSYGVFFVQNGYDLHVKESYTTNGTPPSNDLNKWFEMQVFRITSIDAKGWVATQDLTTKVQDLGDDYNFWKMAGVSPPPKGMWKVNKCERIVEYKLADTL